MKTISQFKVSGFISVILGLLVGLCSCFGNSSNEEKEEIPLVSSAEFKDGGAYGNVLSITEEYGNINTEFIKSDIKTLGIENASFFLLKYETMSLLLFQLTVVLYLLYFLAYSSYFSIPQKYALKVLLFIFWHLCSLTI